MIFFASSPKMAHTFQKDIFMTANEWIQRLALAPHPEGGHYRETYRAPEQVPQQALPARFKGDRAFSTAIYFLLAHPDFSAFHRIPADELWHFYDGSPVRIHMLDQCGGLKTAQLGIADGASPQVTVPAGCWFAAELARPGTWALAGCTVAPGFDFADFTMARRTELRENFPQHRPLIERLTR
jgi:predicted cupin superfamily sugar epimerase